MNDIIIVEFACDANGNHTAPMSSCLDTKRRRFTSSEKAISFVERCTYVYNLDEIFQNTPEELIPPSLQGEVCSLLCD